ncbi:hypothetical protein [Ectopseudomonas mendocina]|uniref:hypothetical protein n=1 Tax=Ectopseudomonas mendocina TaxID=300 RepID=UPI001AE05290|nr:hypothetical protein [Pseudomonas mendocina]
MNRLIVERKLDSLQRCLERIRSKAPTELEPLSLGAQPEPRRAGVRQYRCPRAQ